MYTINYKSMVHSVRIGEYYAFGNMSTLSIGISR